MKFKIDKTIIMMYNKYRSKENMPVCRNWQTRQTQNLLSARVCGFKSHYRHFAKHRINTESLVFMRFLFILKFQNKEFLSNFLNKNTYIQTKIAHESAHKNTRQQSTYHLLPVGYFLISTSDSLLPVPHCSHTLPPSASFHAQNRSPTCP